MSIRKKKIKEDLVDANKLVKPSTYAATRGVSPQNIYSLVARGKLTSKEIDGTIFVVLP